MNDTHVSSGTPNQVPEPATIDMTLEVVNVPVSGIDRAKRFYESLGWRLDGDSAVGEDFRVVQYTPLHSQCAITFGTGVKTAAHIFHHEIRPFHSAGTDARVPGPDPQGRSYFTWASFSDPDDDGWLKQEIKTRLPGREWKDRPCSLRLSRIL